ncbi:hypothetical protein EGW08_017792 [Elysia chlorotica]|uniref:Gamma-glutamylcyclotransferase family protein n=1 Tax=Elysia chlorotica TaxID=188477 RepID=A0A433SYQ3_ELYCH|nr:hypothetical protein EGW08_017792 [Elysia chlorotica]
MSYGGKHIVFVYGTLKTGLRNHEVMTNPHEGLAKFLGSGETVLRYPMVVNEEFHVPFLLHREGEGEHIEGELYQVDDAKLSSLDHLEGHPHFYQRLVTRVKTSGKDFPPTVTSLADAGSVVEAWTYFIMSFRQELLDLPKLKSYSSTVIYKVAPEEMERRRLKLRMFVRGSS